MNSGKVFGALIGALIGPMILKMIAPFGTKKLAGLIGFAGGGYLGWTKGDNLYQIPQLGGLLDKLDATLGLKR